MFHHFVEKCIANPIQCAFAHFVIHRLIISIPMFVFKKLDDEQLKSLTSHIGASIPLWLVLACEELRVYGDFRTLTTRIQELPDLLDGLMDIIVDRLISDDETSYMEKVLLYLHHTGIYWYSMFTWITCFAVCMLSKDEV